MEQTILVFLSKIFFYEIPTAPTCVFFKSFNENWNIVINLGLSVL